MNKVTLYTLDIYGYVATRLHTFASSTKASVYLETSPSVVCRRLKADAPIRRCLVRPHTNEEPEQFKCDYYDTPQRYALYNLDGRLLSDAKLGLNILTTADCCEMFNTTMVNRLQSHPYDPINDMYVIPIEVGRIPLTIPATY